MGAEQEKYDDDPYIRQSQIQNPVQNFYSNIALCQTDEKFNASIITKQQKKAVTTQYKNPIKLDKNSLRLETDAYNKNKSFLTFTYSAERVIYGNVYFNSNFNPKPNQNESFYCPTKPFQNCIIKLTLQPGNNLICREPNLFIDYEFFNKNRIYDNNYFDVIIELYALDLQMRGVEYILSTFCKVFWNRQKYEIKPIMQKCKVGLSEWYNIEDIYGINSESQLCDICCVNNKNTFFLPCKHSFACQECAIMLRIKSNGCPICRQRIYILYNILAITDSVILETTNSN